MHAPPGIIFAIIALFSFGFGDFFIQKSTRQVGTIKSLFLIGDVGFFVFLPFVYREALAVIRADVWLWFILVTAGVAILTSLLDFESLRQGKIAVVEPLLGIELSMAVILSVSLGGEQLDWLKASLITVIFFGLVLVATRQFSNLMTRRHIFEKAVALGILGGIGMALTDFLVGTASKSISALTVVWFVHSIIALFCLVHLVSTGEIWKLKKAFAGNFGVLFFQSSLDNVGWVAYASSMALTSVSIGTAISESYIALGCLLGIYINKEKIKPHQVAGIALVVCGVTFLAYVV